MVAQGEQNSEQVTVKEYDKTIASYKMAQQELSKSRKEEGIKEYLGVLAAAPAAHMTTVHSLNPADNDPYAVHISLDGTYSSSVVSFTNSFGSIEQNMIDDDGHDEQRIMSRPTNLHMSGDAWHNRIILLDVDGMVLTAALALDTVSGRFVKVVSSEMLPDRMDMKTMMKSKFKNEQLTELKGLRTFKDITEKFKKDQSDTLVALPGYMLYGKLNPCNLDELKDAQCLYYANYARMCCEQWESVGNRSERSRIREIERTLNCFERMLHSRGYGYEIAPTDRYRGYNLPVNGENFFVWYDYIRDTKEVPGRKKDYYDRNFLAPAFHLAFSEHEMRFRIPLGHMNGNPIFLAHAYNFWSGNMNDGYIFLVEGQTKFPPYEEGLDAAVRAFGESILHRGILLSPLIVEKGFKDSLEIHAQRTGSEAKAFALLSNELAAVHAEVEKGHPALRMSSYIDDYFTKPSQGYGYFRFKNILHADKETWASKSPEDKIKTIFQLLDGAVNERKEIHVSKEEIALLQMAGISLNGREKVFAFSRWQTDARRQLSLVKSTLDNYFTTRMRYTNLHEEVRKARERIDQLESNSEVLSLKAKLQDIEMIKSLSPVFILFLLTHPEYTPLPLHVDLALFKGPAFSIYLSEKADSSSES